MTKALLGFRRTRVTYHCRETIITIIVGFVNLYIFFFNHRKRIVVEIRSKKNWKKISIEISSFFRLDVSTKLLNRVLRPGDLDIFPGETLLQGVASGACLGFGVGRRDEGREDEGAGERSSLRDDISRTGNRI